MYRRHKLLDLISVGVCYFKVIIAYVVKQLSSIYGKQRLITMKNFFRV
jgi:hypothetical protein